MVRDERFTIKRGRDEEAEERAVCIKARITLDCRLITLTSYAFFRSLFC